MASLIVRAFVDEFNAIFAALFISSESIVKPPISPVVAVMLPDIITSPVLSK